MVCRSPSSTPINRSEVEEARPGGIGWERTGIVAAEDAIAVTRYEAVGPIPD